MRWSSMSEAEYHLKPVMNFVSWIFSCKQSVSQIFNIYVEILSLGQLIFHNLVHTYVIDIPSK